jgi:hypothetical protein
MKTKVLAVSLPLALFALAACGGAPPSVATPAVPSAQPAPAGDPHGFEADEYIIAFAPTPTEWTGHTEGRLAKMEKAAEKAGDSATFFRMDNNSEHKSQWFWKSHPAAKEDLKPGTLVTYFRTEGVKGEDAMPAPKDHASSRKGYWVVSHVSDVAKIDSGVVKVGSQNVHIEAIRILVEPHS